MRNRKLKAPFPYMGGKSSIADVVWNALGDVQVYIEPFFGSGAVLLQRPHTPRIETINEVDGVLTNFLRVERAMREVANDLDPFLSNFWRALQHDPEAVANWADNIVSELDLHARHRWLVSRQDFIERMRSDPDYYDVKIAGWWVWGSSCWIGNRWCVVDNQYRSCPDITAQLSGRGIHQQRPMITGNTPGIGVQPLAAQLPQIQGDRFVNGVAGCETIQPWFHALAARLRRVRICCGDWRRVCTPAVLNGAGTTGIFLDPPYAHAEREPRLYGQDEDISQEVARWAREVGEHPQYRAVLCGYENEHEMPGWRVIRWHANGGYGNRGKGRGRHNRTRECLWLSPHCIEHQLSLFGGDHADAH